jgi:hypothetical protein
MPADGTARHVLSPPTRQRGQPRLRISVAGAGYPPARCRLRLAGRPGRAEPRRGDLICFSSTHRSCIVEFSPTLSTSKSGAQHAVGRTGGPIWSGMRSAPGKPGLDFIACREHILSGRRGTGKPAGRSCVFQLSSPTPTATPLSLTFPPRTSSSRVTFPPDAVNRPRPCSCDVQFQL